MIGFGSNIRRGRAGCDGCRDRPSLTSALGRPVPAGVHIAKPFRRNDFPVHGDNSFVGISSERTAVATVRKCYVRIILDLRLAERTSFARKTLVYDPLQFFGRDPTAVGALSTRLL
jgi:hypothetical protein